MLIARIKQCLQTSPASAQALAQATGGDIATINVALETLLARGKIASLATACNRGRCGHCSSACSDGQIYRWVEA